MEMDHDWSQVDTPSSHKDVTVPFVKLYSEQKGSVEGKEDTGRITLGWLRMELLNGIKLRNCRSSNTCQVGNQNLKPFSSYLQKPFGHLFWDTLHD